MDESLKINYHELQRKLDSEPDSGAPEVLRMQLQRYESILGNRVPYGG